MPTDLSSLLLFAPENSRPFGAAVARALGVSLASSEERDFEYGEHKMRPLTPVRNRDVYVCAQLCGDAAASANDRLVKLLFFIGALKDAGAARVTACAPYLAYARKDRRTKANDPIATRYVATLFEAAGADGVAALDVHNLAAFENAFRIPTYPLDSALLFVEHLRTLPAGRDWVVASPDVGGVKRAQHVRQLLQAAFQQPVGFAFMEKQRSAGVVSGETLAGDVADKRVVFVDDMISSGATMLRAAAACRKAGASEVRMAATHAVFAPAAHALFDDQAAPESVAVTDSVALREGFQRYAGDRLQILNIAPFYAALIARLHAGESVNELCGLA